MHTYLAMKPHVTGHPQGGGYQCGACGLEGLSFGEPHYRAGDGSSSQVCEPAVAAHSTTNHPQHAFAGKGIRARPAIGLGYGHILERRGDNGRWVVDDLSVSPDTFAQPTPALQPAGEQNPDITPAVPGGSFIAADPLKDEPGHTVDDFSPNELAALKAAEDRPVGTATQLPLERDVPNDQPFVPGQPTADVPPIVAPPTFVPPPQMTQGGGSLTTDTPEGSDGEHTT